MELLLKRRPSYNEATIGELYIVKDAEATHECYTLEDVVREVPGRPVEEWKIPTKTAIPAGTYRLIITQSPRFTGLEGHPVFTPELVNVPGFNGVRIHPGNYPKDTDGCILPGVVPAADGTAVWSSRTAYENLFTKIRNARGAGEEVHLHVQNVGD